MKIFIVCLIVSLLFFACTQQQVQPYKSGKYKLKQSYLSGTTYGTIYFYNQNEFYTTLAGANRDYVFYQKSGRIHATCKGCTSTYIFHVSETTEMREKWQANISGSFLTWEISK